MSRRCPICGRLVPEGQRTCGRPGCVRADAKYASMEVRVKGMIAPLELCRNRRSRPRRPVA